MPQSIVLFAACNSSATTHLLVLPDGRRIGGMLGLPGRVRAVRLELDLQRQLGAVRLRKVLRSLPSTFILPKAILVARSALLLRLWVAPVVVRSTLVAVGSITVHIRIVDHLLLGAVHVGVLQECVADRVLLPDVVVMVASAAPLILLVEEALLLQLIFWTDSVHSKRLKYLPLRLVIRASPIEVVHSVALVGVGGAGLARPVLLVPPRNDDRIPRSRIATGGIFGLSWLEDIAVRLRINDPAIGRDAHTDDRILNVVELYDCRLGLVVRGVGRHHLSELVQRVRVIILAIGIALIVS